MLNWNSIIIGWTKNEATLHFAGYLENYTKDIYMIFADIKASVGYTEYVYTSGLVTLFHTLVFYVRETPTDTVILGF